ncbi:hypothetical protein MTO96_010894 [Rhipicephalus appendiculatus]
MKRRETLDRSLALLENNSAEEVAFCGFRCVRICLRREVAALSVTVTTIGSRPTEQHSAPPKGECHAWWRIGTKGDRPRSREKGAPRRRRRQPSFGLRHLHRSARRRGRWALTLSRCVRAACVPPPFYGEAKSASTGANRDKKAAVTVPCWLGRCYQGRVGKDARGLACLGTDFLCSRWACVDDRT